MGQVRLSYRDGLSIRAIDKKVRISRQSVRKALQHAEPPPFDKPQPRNAPKLGPFKPLIDQILEANRKAPPKQRHYGTHIFERLVNEHNYQGSYDQVRRCVQCHRRALQETFVPLHHAPGDRLECDFGHIYVDFPDGRRAVPVLVLTWAYSCFPFAIALPSEKTEAIVHGMTEGFAFLGCVNREVWWDNPTWWPARCFSDASVLCTHGTRRWPVTTRSRPGFVCRPRWITPRCTSTGTYPDVFLLFARSWSSISAVRRAPGSTSGCCNCWLAIRPTGFAGWWNWPWIANQPLEARWGIGQTERLAARERPGEFGTAIRLHLDNPSQ